MNLLALRNFCSDLLANDVDPDLPVTLVVDGRVLEVCAARLVTGPYEADPFPYLTGHKLKLGQTLGLQAAGHDFAQLPQHKLDRLPVPFPEAG